jgi:hypothetical protein
VFFACQTQWVIDGMSGTYRSLNYPGVAVVLDMLAPNNRREVFAGIQVMESAALAVLQKRAEQKN